MPSERDFRRLAPARIPPCPSGRGRRPSFAWLLALWCLLVGHLEAVVAASNRQPRPNVVFILADDLGWGELGCYGQKKIPTPNIDRLASRGMRFTRHYSGAPVCAPSRCVLMTGRHLGHAEIRGNLQAKARFPAFDEGQFPLRATARTLARAFKDAGYSTAAIGKWGLGPVGSTGDPNRQGFDWFFGYNCQAAAHSYYPPHLWRNGDKIPLNAKPVPGHRSQPTGDVRAEDWIGESYAPAAMVREAEEFIAAAADRPFFLYLPFIEPHVSLHPPPALLDRFPREWDSRPYRGLNGYLPHPRPRAAYAALIADLDDHVGRVLAALERHGLEDRTLVVFTSDNGPTHPGTADPTFGIGGVDTAFFDSTGGLRGFKGGVYEGGLRVPLIVRWPGRIPSGTVNDTPGYFADWFPTLCDATGIPRPAGLDGDSLWPAMIGKPAIRKRRPMVWVFPEYGGQVALRIGDMKLVRCNLATDHPRPWEVYDLSKDPTETHDLAASNAGLVRRAEDILRREMDENPVFPVAVPGIVPVHRNRP